MIYMRGIKAKDLEALLDFAYHGEANVYQEDLEGFIIIANELQIKGLERFENDPTNRQEKKEGQILDYKKENNTESVEVKEEPHTSSNSGMPVDVAPLINIDPDKDLNDQIDLYAKRINGVKEKLWKCTICGKVTKRKHDIRRHIETHLEGVSHPCLQCEKVSKSSNALMTHVSVYHRNNIDIAANDQSLPKKSITGSKLVPYTAMRAGKQEM